jgi:hypothetical protein
MDPDRLARRYGVASGGEKRMIAAALSFYGRCRLSGRAKELAEEFEFNHLGGLDANNITALMGAVAIESGHSELAPGEPVVGA